MQRPQWNKDKGIALLRLGGLSPVKQKVRQIVPERYGMWAFIFPYWDWWFVSGPMTQAKFPKKEVPKHLVPKPRKFWAKGTIYTRFPADDKSVPVEAEPNTFFGYADWYKTDDQELYDGMNKRFAEDIAHLRRLAEPWWFGEVTGEELAKIQHPHARGQGGCMSVDHMEVFVPRGTIIT